MSGTRLFDQVEDVVAGDDRDKFDQDIKTDCSRHCLKRTPTDANDTTNTNKLQIQLF